MNNIELYKNKYKELENELKGVRLFRVGITNVYMVGHSIIDAICRSFDLDKWEQINSIDECSLAENSNIDNYRFNNIFLNQVKEFGINLKLKIKINGVNDKSFETKIDDENFEFEELINYFTISLIMSYDESNTKDLDQQFQNILNGEFHYKNNILKQNI